MEFEPDEKSPSEVRRQANVTYNTVLSMRTEHNISQIKLAEYSGYSPALISSWELKKRRPTMSQIDKLIAAVAHIVAVKDELGIDIRKKRVRHAGKLKRNAPAQIQTKTDYDKLMKNIDFSPNDYALQLSEIHQYRPRLTENAPKAVALFSGCGGLTLGFQWAGFNVVGHVEIDDSANSIYKANFPDSVLLGKDVTCASDDDVKNWSEQFGRIDALIGGPPCQGFSLAGKRNPEDERNELFQHYIRIVGIVRPKVFVMENVRLMTSMKDKDGNLFIDRIIEGYGEIGYKIAIKAVNAQEYGAPQFRERVFLVGTDMRMAMKMFVFPEPTNSDSFQASLFSNAYNPILSFRDAVSDLPILENGEISSDPLHWAIVHPEHVIDWLKDVPEGHSAHENEDPCLRPPSGFNTTYKRLIWDEPCSTISTNFNMISGCRNVHPSSTRSLTIREATRAQSFPDGFAFFGKWSDVRRAIGNAVPPLLAKAIADGVKGQLFNF
ncbi:MAG: DNA (cytosine-5-)-methyltransferase [Deltaproteobacteria bacterium]|jgi:DNA (cytosine-5)-methyltransferase 1|nr:DNA (cytosine-5-)-methyltransferase [Deltaproteobacteria bacterium]